MNTPGERLDRPTCRAPAEPVAPVTPRPLRQVRASFDDDGVTVYQAYSPQIADAALEAGTFVPPFKRGRMTWIKPSFLWMMYRCGWATKPGQERVLAIRICRTGFEWALAHSALSHYDPSVYANYNEWQARKAASQVRVQWDPERSLHFDPLTHRTIQVGLGGETVNQYADSWILGITDISTLAHRVHHLVTTYAPRSATALLPTEEPYPLSTAIKAAIGAT